MPQNTNPGNPARRDMLKFAGAGIAATALPASGVALAQASPALGGAGLTGGADSSAGSPSSNKKVTHKRVTTNGVTLHYVTAGTGPAVLCMHGWPQNHREFFPIIDRLADKYTFIAPDLRGFADSDKPFDGYEPKTIAQDMIGLLDAENVKRFHIVSHDLGGPPSVALAYMANDRALSLATIETPFFGLDFPGYVDPRVPYWHLGMHMNMDITRFLVEGREEEYLRDSSELRDANASAWKLACKSELLWIHSSDGRADERAHPYPVSSLRRHGSFEACAGALVSRESEGMGYGRLVAWGQPQYIQ